MSRIHEVNLCYALNLTHFSLVGGSAIIVLTYLLWRSN